MTVPSGVPERDIRDFLDRHQGWLMTKLAKFRTTKELADGGYVMIRGISHRIEATGRLRGWNVRLEQNELDAPCEPLRRRGEPITFGHYAVEPLSGYRLPVRCGPGLMLDYGRGKHARFDPLARLRDPIVALEAGETRLLLGCSYVDLGVVRMTTPSFFLLVYDGPLATPR